MAVMQASDTDESWLRSEAVDGFHSQLPSRLIPHNQTQNRIETGGHGATHNKTIGVQEQRTVAGQTAVAAPAWGQLRLADCRDQGPMAHP
jgi:hypothetical protein